MKTALLLVYLQLSVPNLRNHQKVISITVSSPKIQHIEYTRMQSPFYQLVVYLVVSLPMRRGPGVLINISVREHRALNS
jgi:hypothetical protein